MTVDILHVTSTSLGLSSVYTGVMSAIIIRCVLLTVGTARKTTRKPILVLHVTPSATRQRAGVCCHHHIIQFQEIIQAVRREHGPRNCSCARSCSCYTLGDSSQSPVP